MVRSSEEIKWPCIPERKAPVGVARPSAHPPFAYSMQMLGAVMTTSGRADAQGQRREHYEQNESEHVNTTMHPRLAHTIKV